MNRFFQFLLGVDQLVNVTVSLVIGGGWADESISARAYRCKDRKYWYTMYRIINNIFFWQQNHCKEAFESEKSWKHLPIEYRENNYED